MRNPRQFALICGIFALASLMQFHAAAVPKNTQTLELSAGWNLVALKGTPLNTQKFLELKPMVYEEESHSYVLCTEDTEMMRGMALWIFSAVAKNVEVPLVSASVTAPEMQLGAGWNLVGTADAEPSWLEQVARPFFRWDAEKGFVPAETPEVKSGYWVKAK